MKQDKPFTSGEAFLHSQNKDFHHDPMVEATGEYLRANGEKIPNDPEAKIQAYLGLLADTYYVNDGVLTHDEESITRQVEAASIALTSENAEKYAEFRAKIDREEGRGGDVNPDRLDMNAKMEVLGRIRSDQETQLREWIDELNDDENAYPDWFKHWVFENVRRHTTFNEQQDKNGYPKGFEERSRSSFALFPELDPKSVKLVYETLTGQLGDEFENDDIKSLLPRVKFSELYAKAQEYGFTITDQLKEVTTGSWRSFGPSNSLETAKDFSSAVHKKYRSGFCTKGLETAAGYLRDGGNVKVFFSTNPETKEDDVPRLIIRMRHGKVVEVRGIDGARQEVEPPLLDEVMGKLRALYGGETYIERAGYMKQLTEIDRLVTADHEATLSDDQVRLLYELDHDIKGLGYGRDPRLDEVRVARGTHDQVRITQLLPEVLAARAEASYDGYAVTAHRLGLESASREEFMELLKEASDKWSRDGGYAYVTEELLASGGVPYVVGTPEVVVDWPRLEKLARRLPLREDAIDDNFLRRFTNEQLCGSPQGTGPVRFGMILSASTKRLGNMRAPESLDELRVLQRERPGLDIRIPSLLDTFTFWRTLQASGFDFDTSSDTVGMNVARLYGAMGMQYPDMTAKLGDDMSILGADVSSDGIYIGGYDREMLVKTRVIVRSDSSAV